MGKFTGGESGLTSGFDIDVNSFVTLAFDFNFYGSIICTTSFGQVICHFLEVEPNLEQCNVCKSGLMVDHNSDACFFLALDFEN